MIVREGCIPFGGAKILICGLGEDLSWYLVKSMKVRLFLIK